MVSVEKLGGSVVTVDVKMGITPPSEEVVTGSCNTVEEPATGPDVVDGAKVSGVGDPSGKVEGPAVASEVVDSVTVSEVVESVVDTADELAPLLEVTGGKLIASEADEGISESVVELPPVAVSVVEIPLEETGIPVGMTMSMLFCGRGLASVPPSKRKDKKREPMAKEGTRFPQSKNYEGEKPMG